MATVELHEAWCWTCDDCGRDNFCRSRWITPQPNELDEILAKVGMTREDYDEWLESDPDHGGKFSTMPEWVKCEHCGAQFAAEHAE